MEFRVVDKINGFDFVASGDEDWALGLNNNERDKALKLKVGQSLKCVGDGDEEFTITRKESLS